MILKPANGAKKNKKRVGRGPGSGMGKTSTRGHNGQKSRKGGGIRIGFEGGQTPLYRRLPKRGFKNAPFKKEYKEVNLFILNNLEENTCIDIEKYLELGLVNSKNDKIKILGNGKLTKKLEIHANKFSESSKKKIEDAGGKIVIIK